MKIHIPPATQRTQLPTEEELIEEEDDDLELQTMIESTEHDESDANGTDDEDGLDWMFEEGETQACDPKYVFCPAVHRHQLLHLFTKHFCQHPTFPDDAGHHTAGEIYSVAVREMYQFCVTCGLWEVWGYFWTSWYQPVKWKLWSRSTSPYLPRWWTTMSVENFWRQLKHDYLHNHIRLRLDQLVWIIQTRVVPNYMVKAMSLEDTSWLGHT